MATRPPEVPTLRAYPTRGPTGERDNLERLVRTVGLLMATAEPPLLYIMTMGHTAGCPCEVAGAGIPGCTCDTVDVMLEEVGGGLP